MFRSTLLIGAMSFAATAAFAQAAPDAGGERGPVSTLPNAAATAPALPPNVPTPVPVSAAAAELPPSYLCQVNASDRIELASPIVGVLDQTLVKKGDVVAAGQPIATLRADVEKADLALAEARANFNAQLESKKSKLAYAQRKLDRNTELGQRNLVSANDLDEMRTDRDMAAQDVQATQEAMKLAQLDLAKARAELDLHIIRSPIAGVVTERKLSAGELVRDQPVAVIQKVDPLYIEVALPVGLMGKIAVGRKGKVVFDVPGVTPQLLPVTLVDRVLEPTSNTFGVRLEVRNPDRAIPAGAKCRVAFDQP